MSICLTIVCENTVGKPVPVLGEHGFACLVEVGREAWLFDTGGGSTLLHNLTVLGIDPHRIDGVVLSHGHADHSGGLAALLSTIGRRPVVAHPGVFARRYWQGKHERRDISLPTTREQLEAIGADFQFCETRTELAPGLVFSGEIPRANTFECGDPHLMMHVEQTQSLQQDTFIDDAALAIETGKGLVVLLGCAHAGLVNTLDYCKRILSCGQVHAVVGGTHLGPASDAQFEATLGYLARQSISRFAVSHCTGLQRAAQLHAHLPNRVSFASVGFTLEV